MVSPMPSHWLGGVFHLLSRVEGLFELTKATWPVHSLFPEPDLLIPTPMALFHIPFPSPSVTILTLTRSAPNRIHDWKIWETRLVIVSNQQ